MRIDRETNGRTDMINLIFRNFANAPKNCIVSVDVAIPWATYELQTYRIKTVVLHAQPLTSVESSQPSLHYRVAKNQSESFLFLPAIYVVIRKHLQAFISIVGRWQHMLR
jgi:hypothetical protein